MVDLMKERGKKEKGWSHVEAMACVMDEGTTTARVGVLF